MLLSGSVRTLRSGLTVLLLSVGAAAGCDVNTMLHQQTEARHLAADLVVQFTKAADASNRAVMAEADDASAAFVQEARQAMLAAQGKVDALRPILQELNYASESELLTQFDGQFSAYRELDGRILDLAVENTNLKARRLSFGAAQAAADAFRSALEAAVPPARSSGDWQAAALVASAVAAARQIQVLEAPHIAEASDAGMLDLEKKMVASEESARTSLTALAAHLGTKERVRLTAASAALDDFLRIHAEILALSRRNTNVRSLALSLDQKRTLVAACEETLRALQEALAKRRLTGTR